MTGAARAIRVAARGGQWAVQRLLFYCPNPLARINPKPIFVLGNQKSGTSAISRLLGMSTGLSVAPDLAREVGKQFYLRIVTGEVPFRRLIERNRRDFARDIIKEPNLTLFYRELRAHFPAARCVMIVRDPRDNIRSILNRVNVPGNLAAMGRSSAYRIDPGFELVLGRQWPGIKAMPHYIEQLAERWNYFSDVYLCNRDDIVLVRYEDFNRDKQQAIVQLARRLDLTPRHDIADKVDVQFQPRGDRSVKWSIFYGEENLSRIERICEQRMASLGYEPVLQ